MYLLLKELSVIGAGGGLNSSSVLIAFAMLFRACSMRVHLKGILSLLQVHNRIREVHSPLLESVPTHL